MPMLKIRLNGTNENPWHRLGLKQNPFPQIAKAEFDRGERAIRSLDGDPLKSQEDIRERLKGKVSEEVIELCCSQFRLGEQVEFEVSWEDE